MPDHVALVSGAIAPRGPEATLAIIRVRLAQVAAQD